MEKGRIVHRLAKDLKLPEERKTFNRYLKLTTSDPLREIANAYVEWARDKQGWKYEVFEEAFRFGRELASQYRLTQERVEVLFNNYLACFGGIVGFFISGFLRAMKDFTVRFSVRSASGIGFRLKGGRIFVEGRTTYLGMEMEDGEIFTSSTGNYLGKGMKGGRIVAGKAGDWVGMEMKGGTIIVSNAGNALGFAMEGGEIVAEVAGAWVGESSKGGRIVIGQYESIGDGKAEIVTRTSLKTY
ncbi:glutamate synthase [Archaeoglobus veneficus]|uniref:Glutamate synthase alpha subunit domain protein n=1 Tax=Archaeoglobus veneficus (strain DSM 11195 / SNP6) TaxID=693661 RepID=F2KRC0_ARCVS|nr:glutamate synthase [Archaeoglobus veneficus]AEA47854.1 glutamate synthase alpha subunit domain protein [Archaeoglobus veneficus SNP6]